MAGSVFTTPRFWRRRVCAGSGGTNPQPALGVSDLCLSGPYLPAKGKLNAFLKTDTLGAKNPERGAARKGGTNDAADLWHPSSPTALCVTGVKKRKRETPKGKVPPRRPGGADGKPWGARAAWQTRGVHVPGGGPCRASAPCCLGREPSGRAGLPEDT